MTVLAAVQMNSGDDVAANLACADQLLAKAAEAGAQVAVLPENFALMGDRESAKLRIAEADGDGPLQAFLADAARRHDLWLVGGTIPVASGDGRAYASCMVFGPDGARAARYDKIHLFDVHVPGSDERYAESKATAPGNERVVVDTGPGRLGVAVCYDARFPELFRAMVDAGMELLALPAAFTAATGAAHWDVLVRARAIENQCYVVAAAQTGSHPGGRRTHGHSLICDPWGTVLAELPDGAGVVSARFDRTFLERTRREFPALDHRSRCT